MVILIGIIATLIFVVALTIKDNTPSEKTHIPNQALSNAIARAKKRKSSIEVFESVVVAMFICLGIAIFFAIAIRIWISGF